MRRYSFGWPYLENALLSNITTQELSERAGISRGLLRRIENGDPACIGFEVATLLATAFQSDYDDLCSRTPLIAENSHKCTLSFPAASERQRAEIRDDSSEPTQQ